MSAELLRRGPYRDFSEMPEDVLRSLVKAIDEVSRKAALKARDRAAAARGE